MAKPEPGRDPEMARRTEKLNLLFALTSIGLLIAFSWMIWADYDREWKKHQIEFNKLEVKLTAAADQQELGKVGADRKTGARGPAGPRRARRSRRSAARSRRPRPRPTSSTPSGTPSTRTTASPRPTSTWSATSTRRRPTTGAPRRREAEGGAGRPREAVGRAAARARGREGAARTPRRRRLAELEKTRLDAEKQQKEALGEYDRLQDRLRKIEPGFVSFVAEPADPRPREPVAEGQPDHAGEPLRRRDLLADAEGGSLHDLPSRHRQEGLREGAPALHHAIPTSTPTCAAPTRWRRSAARPATRGAVAPRAS